MMKNKIYILIALIFFATSCSMHQMSEPECALYMDQKYQEIRQIYKSHYTAVDNEQQEYLRKNVAPILDQALAVLHSYTLAVKAGNYDAKSKQEFWQLIRKATSMLEVEDER